MVPLRGKVFIRKVETEENYPGSAIVIPEHIRDKVSSCQFEVVRVGDYAFCDDEDCERPHGKGHQHKHHLCEGDWVLCIARSWMETLEPGLYLINADDIIGKFVGS